MWADNAMLAVSGLKSLVGYSDARKQAVQDKKWQNYNNAMVRIQDAGNQNAITTNENIAREKATSDKFAVRKSAYITKASAEVSAAAAGTTGRSVDIALYDIGRNEAMMIDSVGKDLEAQYLQFTNQREGSAMQAKTSQDFRGLPQPNAATYMLGFATDAYSIMNQDR
jgi:hypothetical protein